MSSDIVDKIISAACIPEDDAIFSDELDEMRLFGPAEERERLARLTFENRSQGGITVRRLVCVGFRDPTGIPAFVNENHVKQEDIQKIIADRGFTYLLYWKEDTMAEHL